VAGMKVGAERFYLSHEVTLPDKQLHLEIGSFIQLTS
jgi:hypothetical protein